MCVWDGFGLCLRCQRGCCPPSCCSTLGESGKERLRWFTHESTTISYISLTTHGAWASYNPQISKVSPLHSLSLLTTTLTLSAALTLQWAPAFSLMCDFFFFHLTFIAFKRVFLVIYIMEKLSLIFHTGNKKKMSAFGMKQLLFIQEQPVL